jgi:hypothetical protein
MGNQSRPFRPDLWPFNVMMIEDARGTEWWIARELMPFLGVISWEAMKITVGKAMQHCQNMGFDVGEHFGNVTHEDCFITRCGGDFVMTNLLLDDLDPDPPPDDLDPDDLDPDDLDPDDLDPDDLDPDLNLDLDPPPDDRVRPVLGPACRYFHRYHPISFDGTAVHDRGSFSIISHNRWLLYRMGDKFVPHVLPLKPTDRPDGLMGEHWAKYRLAQGRDPATRTGSLNNPDWSADLTRVKYYPTIGTWAPIYPMAEFDEFREWLWTSYMPAHFPQDD